MVAWINFVVLLFASILLLFFYVRSARPAGREKVIGPRAYRLCFYDREEQDLLLRYGEAYAESCKRTGAFWPKRRQNNA